MEITLQWTGPFGLATPDQRKQFSPPNESGVYLWTVANEKAPRVSYVGEAGNVADRFYEHVFCILGGAYCLCDRRHLVDGKTPHPVDRPSRNALFADFLDENGCYWRLARRNLFACRFGWATLPGERRVCEAVESALITEARERDQPLQNERVRCGRRSSPRL